MTPAKKKFGRRGIFLLPNLFTSAALFAGFYSIVAAVGGNFQKAGAAIFVAISLSQFQGGPIRTLRSIHSFDWYHIDFYAKFS